MLDSSTMDWEEDFMSTTRSNVNFPAFFPAPLHPHAIRILRPTPIIIPYSPDITVSVEDFIGKKWEKTWDLPKERPELPIDIDIAAKKGGYTDFKTLPLLLKKTAAFENYCKIIGEAVKNSYDSKAENITVSIECVSASQLTIAVQDNGTGFGEILEKGYLRFALRTHRNRLDRATFEDFLKRHTSSEAILDEDKAEKPNFDEQKAIEQMLEKATLRSLLKNYLQEQIKEKIDSRGPLDYAYVLNGGMLHIMSDKRSLDDQIGGSGLGLAQLWRCMNQNEGSLHVCNKEEGGAIIIISSPLEKSKKTLDLVREAHRTGYHRAVHSRSATPISLRTPNGSPSTPASSGELQLRPGSAMGRLASVPNVEGCSSAGSESLIPVSPKGIRASPPILLSEPGQLRSPRPNKILFRPVTLQYEYPESPSLLSHTIFSPRGLSPRSPFPAVDLVSEAEMANKGIKVV